MKNKLIVLVLAVVLVGVGFVMVNANSEVGNKFCPVSGEKLGGAMGDPIKVEYKGKNYNLCCQMCVKDFNKDPEKYIKKIEEQMKSSSHEDHNHDH